MSDLYGTGLSRNDADAIGHENEIMEWGSQFACGVHGNMGRTFDLAEAVTSRKTCLLCEVVRGQDAAILERVSPRDSIGGADE